MLKKNKEEKEMEKDAIIKNRNKEKKKHRKEIFRDLMVFHKMIILKILQILMIIIKKIKRKKVNLKE
jgi:hypothetical protein